MREIKFRAWDDVSKVMSFSNFEQFDDMMGFRFSHFETEKPIYMQYTGVNDKNGNEIHEGDIVTDDSVSGPCDGIMGYLSKNSYPVEFVKGCFVVKCNSECASDHIFENYHLLYEMGVVEVIGNIYENPELLEESQ